MGTMCLLEIVRKLLGNVTLGTRQMLKRGLPSLDDVTVTVKTCTKLLELNRPAISSKYLTSYYFQERLLE